jgi:hypothetical protein
LRKTVIASVMIFICINFPHIVFQIWLWISIVVVKKMRKHGAPHLFLDFLCIPVCRWSTTEFSPSFKKRQNRNTTNLLITNSKIYKNINISYNQICSIIVIGYQKDNLPVKRFLTKPNLGEYQNHHQQLKIKKGWI